MRLEPISSDALDASGRGYPRPQLRRGTWFSLNGEWDFALDPGGTWTTPDAVQWTARIRVPFAPETPASGIGNTGFYRWCWYRRRFSLPAVDRGHRIMLRFGAVDFAATVWVNGIWAGCHEGGYTPFAIDITRMVHAADITEIVVCVDDDPHDLSKPRGKQDWQLEPHSI